jgi:hypothetical protein
VSLPSAPDHEPLPATPTHGPEMLGLEHRQTASDSRLDDSTQSVAAIAA